jgi:zinc protease
MGLEKIGTSGFLNGAENDAAMGMANATIQVSNASVTEIVGPTVVLLPLDSTLRCHRAVLSNGLVVLVTANPSADIVAARLLIDAGSRHESSAQAGLSRLLAAVLTKGTAAASARDIAAQVESTGSSLGVDSTSDYFLLTLKTVSSDFTPLLALAADLIQTPTFPDSELELERRLMLQAIKARQEQPMVIALQQLLHAMYPTHPYGQPSLGSLESVAGLTRNDLYRFHRQHFRPEQAVLSISGNLSVESALAVAESLFRSWQPVSLPSVPKFASPSKLDSTPQPISCDTVQPNQQSIVMLGYPAAPVQGQDHTALKLLHTYLCSGLSSRLFTELREKRGLAYEVSGFYPLRRDPSYFVVYIGTAANNTSIAQDLLQAEVERLCQHSLSSSELDMSQRKLLGQYALAQQTNHQIAQRFGLYEFLGLGIDYSVRFPELIRAVTVQDAHQAACRCFGRPFISRVGPHQALRPVL